MARTSGRWKPRRPEVSACCRSRSVTNDWRLSVVLTVQPRPTNGIFAAMSVVNNTLASSGRLAIADVDLTTGNVKFASIE